MKIVQPWFEYDQSIERGMFDTRGTTNTTLMGYDIKTSTLKLTDEGGETIFVKFAGTDYPALVLLPSLPPRQVSCCTNAQRREGR